MSYLQNYNEHRKRFLYLGLTKGFRLHYKGPIRSRYMENHKSLSEQLELFHTKVQKEISNDFTAGPFETPPFDPFIISPVGLIPKHEPGKYRMILDLSYPKGTLGSVNSFIPKEYCTVKYEDFDTVAKIIVKNGKGCLISKADIESAFNILPISPEDYWLLGFCVNGVFYFKKKLPMGSSISCSTFEEFSRAVVFIMRTHGHTNISHILDDFINIGPKNSPICANALQFFINLCKELNIPLNKDKTVEPTTVAILHGIEVCTESFTAKLPMEKLQKAKTIIHNLCYKKKAKLKELQEAIGFLNFACKVIKPGRAFLRRLIDLTVGARSPYHLVKIDRESRKDLKAWIQFLDQYNGVSLLMAEKWASSNYLKFYSDSAQSLGFAAIYNDKWVHGEFSDNEQKLNISILELYPIVLGLYIWSDLLENKCVLMFCDNYAVVHMINKQSSKDVNAMSLIRFLVVTCLKANIYFRAKHIPGVKNSVADSISRQQVARARRIQPTLDKQAVPVPVNMSLTNILHKY